MNKLTFVVPAFGESPYLRDCLNTLCNQTVSTDIVISTSTPNRFIKELANEFTIPLRINSQGGSICKDWNFALQCGISELVVLAHQDDLYHPEFAARCLNLFEAHPNLAIAFTDSAELSNGYTTSYGKRELVKRLLRKMAFLGKDVISTSSQRRRLLGFGCPIPCPSVSYNRRVIQDFTFSDKFSINLDWDAWSRLADAGYKFGYVRGQLVTHRIHQEAETQKGIADKRREKEDALIFARFWPDMIANALLKLYRFGY